MPTSEPPPVPTAAAANQPVPGLAEIFTAFFTLSISGFGGVLPWARTVLVERRRWIAPEEFTDLLALGSFLPGPNIVNVSVMVGARFHGPAGSAAALAGLLGAPIAIVLAASALYTRYREQFALDGMIDAVGAAAAGLFVAMALKLARPLLQQPAARAVFAGLAFTGVGVFRFPLHWVLLALAPLSIAAAWRMRR